MAYEFDLFISYPGMSKAGVWTNEYLIPTLRDAFDDETDKKPVLYNYADRDVGVDWPLEVTNALHKSKYMIAILTPPYFTQSTWCPAEWATMMARLKHVEFPKGKEEARLIYPLVYSDGDHFPQEAKDIRYADLKDYAFPDAAFRESALFMKFRQQLRKLARTIGTALDHPPNWKDGWPTLQRPAQPPAKVSLPRLI